MHVFILEKKSQVLYVHNMHFVPAKNILASLTIQVEGKIRNFKLD